MTVYHSPFFGFRKLLVIGLLLFIPVALATAQEKKDAAKGSIKEKDYYKIQTVPIPEGIKLEVGGMAFLSNDKLAICTRRGKVWIISNPYMKNGSPSKYQLFAEGLHEPLGLTYHKGALYVAQRPGLTRLRDTDGDGVADEYKMIYTFHLSGNYHEYAYGPVFDMDGNMFINLNLAWNGKQMVSKVKWRGWMLKISPKGKVTPIAAGLRSPSGLGVDDNGNIYYSENQGTWVGADFFTKVNKGDFMGYPSPLRWSDLPRSPVNLHVQDIPNAGKPRVDVASHIQGLKLPSVWIPYPMMGISATGILFDDKGQMGPYKGQFFVGDEGESLINRISLEKVKGAYQGVVFPFRKGFSSGVLRLQWGSDGSMFVGMTARGWGSKGGKSFGLQRLVWNGKIPFEMRTIHAEPDGFELVFTQPVDKKTAREASSYRVSSFTYKYHHHYGSPMINKKNASLKAITVSPDGMKVRLVVDSLRRGYIYEIKADGLQSANHHELLHNVGYYTLNQIPEGATLKITPGNSVKTSASVGTSEDTLSMKERGKKHTATKNSLPKGSTVQPATATPTLKEVKPLLKKYGCMSCHQVKKRLIGPPYSQVAKRHYSNDKIVQLIHTPEPEHWPDYATSMPPMHKVTKTDARKIAAWINSLDKK